MKKLLFAFLFLLPFIATSKSTTDTVFSNGSLTATAKGISDTLRVNQAMLGEDLKGKGWGFKMGYNSDILWRYKDADSSHFLLPDYDDKAWTLRFPYFSYDSIQKGVVGKHSVCFRIRIKADSLVVSKPLVLDFKGVGAMEVYLDGKLRGAIGRFDNNAQHDYVNFRLTPVFIALNDTNVHVLAVRYEYNDAKENEDEAWGISLKVKSANNFFQQERGLAVIVAWSLIGMGTLFATLFAVHFLMFLFYRKESSNLYFALFTVSVAILIYMIYIFYGSDSLVEYNSSYIAILAVTSIVGCTSLSAFIAELFSKKKIVLKIILLLGALSLVVAIFDLDSSSEVTNFLLSALFIITIGYTIIGIIVAIFKKVPGALLLGSGILFFFTFFIAIAIWVAVKEELNLNIVLATLMFLAIFSIPFSISAYLAWRFSFVNKSLSKQLIAVETLSVEKESILENQKSELEKEVAVRTQEVREQKRKSDELLLNILPSEVAEELKINGESKAHRYDEVSVLFTDFVNFTRISEQLGVEELLNELNINFTAFDKIMEKHGLEKIKTIGDAYLSVCGLPLSNALHARNTVNAALDILQFVEKRKQEVPYGLDIRIGINSGSLIAGIIGVKKFAYDIWGDTVNTAARMEQHSEPGKINISENTYQLVKDQFLCIHRGKLNAKNKGELDMYFVDRSL